MIHILKKWAIFFCGTWLMLFISCQGASATPTDYTKTPILFVHGFGMNPGTWTSMIEYFVQEGYPPEYLHAVALIPNTGSNKGAASVFIKPAVESLLQLAAETGHQAGYHGRAPQRIDLVSHSMGAASSRWYAAKLHPERVRRWISIAGANHGTNTLCGWSGEGAQEMCPAFAPSLEQSEVQVELNGTPQEPIDESPFGIGDDREQVIRIPPDRTQNIAYFTIRIEPDFWIKPEHSAILDGAGGLQISIPSGIPVIETSPGNYLFTKNVGHDPLPGNIDLIRFVALILALRDQFDGKGVSSITSCINLLLLGPDQ